MMSSAQASQVMLESINSTRQGPFMDLGSGWGTLVIPLARKYPDQQIIGYELSYLPWFISLVRKHFLRLDNLTLHRKDFRKADLSSASTLFCYLFPGGMDALYEKLKQERTSELLIISNTFALPSYPPKTTIRLQDLYNTPIYVYSWSPDNSSAESVNDNSPPNDKEQQ